MYPPFRGVVILTQAILSFVPRSSPLHQHLMPFPTIAWPLLFQRHPRSLFRQRTLSSAMSSSDNHNLRKRKQKSSTSTKPDEQSSRKGSCKKAQKTSSTASTSSTSTTESSTNSNEQNEWFIQFTGNDPLYINYMTTEWGFEKQNDQQLFEKLSLEGAQSGLSWKTILHKREAYRKAFYNFDIDKVAAMKDRHIDKLLDMKSDNPRDLVVRHRGKLESVVNNAKMIQKLKLDGTMDSFGDYLWSFVGHKPILNKFKCIHDMPSKTEESEQMSKALKKLGFKFVGPTTCYSLMQSCGFVIDHPVESNFWKEAEIRLKVREGGYQVRC